MKNYVKKAVQPMFTWSEDTDMNGVSVSQADKDNGSPKLGDMIAVNPKDPKDRWLIAKKFFEDNYTLAEPKGKSLHNTTANGARKNVKDIRFWGNGDTFKLISKASSEDEGWMKSTKAMEIQKIGCVVQVTTQQKNPDGSYECAESITFVPGVRIEDIKKNEEVVGRKLVKA